MKSFFEERVRFYFKDIRGFAYDEVNAAMAARLEQSGGSRNAPWPHSEPAFDAGFRAPGRQFQAHSQHSRTGEIRGARHRRRSLLEPGPESDLYDEYRRIAGQPIESVISRLRPKVDLFFDKVLVNAPDPRVRQNRLTLLHTLRQEFSKVADFSEIVTHS